MTARGSLRLSALGHTLFGLLVALAGTELAGAAELDCVIEPQLTVTVSSPVEAVVQGIAVERGDLVEVGQVVATLESSVERATVEAARARASAGAQIERNKVRLEFAARELTRHGELHDQAVISASQIDEAESEKRLAEVGLREAREEKKLAALELARAEAVLKLRTIRSPIRGVVVERILAPGEYADPPQILKLAQIDPLRVEVFAPLDLLGRIHPGVEAEVVPEPPVSGRYRAVVTVVDRVVEAASGTFGVRLELPNPDNVIPAGLKCTVSFVDPGEGAGSSEEVAGGAP